MKIISILRRSTALAVLTVLGLFSSQVAAAVVLHVDGNGQLHGASGVKVGTLNGTYSVKFNSSSLCSAVFSPCDQSGFTFLNAIDAAAAAQALLDEVFVDSPAGEFDTRPELTKGCLDECYFYTPYVTLGDTVYAMMAFNWFVSVPVDMDIVLGEIVEHGNLGPAVPVFSCGDSTICQWTLWEKDPSDPALPEPGSLSLIGLAGAALIWSSRRRRTGTFVQ